MSAEVKALASLYRKRLEQIIQRAERDGISIRVEREPLQPLAMGHARHVVEAWPARHQPAKPGPQS